MTSFQDAPDKNIEHDEKMELRSTVAIAIWKSFNALLFLWLLFCWYRMNLR